MECGMSTFDWHKNRVRKPYALIAEDGRWIKETVYSFQNIEEENYIEDDFTLKYPHDYAFDYACGQLTSIVSNETITEADFLLKIYGYCENPTVTIGDNAYTVNVEVLTGECLIINSITKKINKVKINGELVNCFYLRDRDNYIFKKILSGKNNVKRNGNYQIELTLFEYRSEPEWWI